MDRGGKARGQAKSKDDERDRPIVIRRSEILEMFDRVLSREEELGEAYLFAFDVVDASRHGLAEVEQAYLLPPLQDLVRMPSVTYELLAEIRDRLRPPHEVGTA